ncbi:hypothetical protein CapIbe_022101 [Capra ibex]
MRLLWEFWPLTVLPMAKTSLLREEDKEHLKGEVGQANRATGTGMMRFLFCRGTGCEPSLKTAQCPPDSWRARTPATAAAEAVNDTRHG